MYEALRFIPVLGFAGSGKSALIAALGDDGMQVLSVEDLAGVTGVCLAPLFGEQVAEQAEIDHRLACALAECDDQRDIYVEWKQHEVTGYHLPAALVAAIRRCPAVLVDTSFTNRVDTLLETYLAWDGRFDAFLVRAEQAGFGADLLTKLRAASRHSTRRFVETLVADYLDPLYAIEINEFSVSRRYTGGVWTSSGVAQ